MRMKRKLNIYYLIEEMWFGSTGLVVRDDYSYDDKEKTAHEVGLTVYDVLDKNVVDYIVNIVNVPKPEPDISRAMNWFDKYNLYHGVYKRVVERLKENPVSFLLFKPDIMPTSLSLMGSQLRDRIRKAVLSGLRTRGNSLVEHEALFTLYVSILNYVLPRLKYELK